jgi:hypothetical protein
MNLRIKEKTYAPPAEVGGVSPLLVALHWPFSCRSLFAVECGVRAPGSMGLGAVVWWRSLSSLPSPIPRHRR